MRDIDEKCEGEGDIPPNIWECEAAELPLEPALEDCGV